MTTRLLFLSIAGVLGTLSRYGLQGVVQPKGHAFPYGVLVVNAVGCLVFGVVASLASHRGVINDETRLILATGFLGSFTTFSAYMYDTQHLASMGQWSLAVANAAGQFAIGLIAVLAGLWLGALV